MHWLILLAASRFNLYSAVCNVIVVIGWMMMMSGPLTEGALYFLFLDTSEENALPFQLNPPNAQPRRSEGID